MKATVWWAMYRYFPFLKGKIGADSINQPGNAMTLWLDAHDQFGTYDIALEATEAV